MEGYFIYFVFKYFIAIETNLKKATIGDVDVKDWKIFHEWIFLWF